MASHLEPNPQQQLDIGARRLNMLIGNIKRWKYQGSVTIASATLDLLEQIINQAENATGLQLITRIRSYGVMLAEKVPDAPTACNIVRRVLRALRFETQCGTSQVDEAAGDSLHHLFNFPMENAQAVYNPHRTLRDAMREHIAELRLEIDSTIAIIGDQSLGHIDSDAVVLCGMATRGTERFLRTALRARRFRLVMAEGPREAQTHELASRFVEEGHLVTVISNTAVFAVMSRVTKVLITVSATLSGGTFLAPTGTGNITSAAKHFKVPVLALCPFYKLTPLHLADSRMLNKPSPQNWHKYKDTSQDYHVHVPMYDFISADHVTVYITNQGGFSPSYIYRLMSELYDPADREL